MKTESKELFDKVIENNYCIGCGACALVKDSPFDIKMNKFGNIVAQPKVDLNSCDAKVLEICPFSDSSKNEDEISSLIFNDIELKDKRIGNYIKIFAGSVKNDKIRARGSSGGLGKWLGKTLLQKDKIDYFIQVVPNQSNSVDKPLFDYHVFTKDDDVLIGSKSSYYPVSLVNVIEFIRKNEGTFAITGVPCFIKTIRLLSLKEEKLKQKIKYTIGIICGGMKSANQAKMIGWQMDVHPSNLKAIDFRRKYVDKPAKYKIYQVWSDKDDTERYRDSFDIFGTDWGSGYFKPNACDYCDDVVAETADISIGDAWLPGYEEDPKGNTITIVRNKELLNILDEYISTGDLILSELTAEDAAKSQAGGLRHRRQGLSYRIAKKAKANKWYPQKRVKPNEFELSKKRKYMFDLREKIANKSHSAFYEALQKDDLNVFFKKMSRLYKKYHNLMYGNIIVRGFNKAKRLLKNRFN